MVRKSATETIRGSVTEDSRKSLSPVRNRSACAFNAARRIGRPFGLRILCSELTASSGEENKKSIKSLDSYQTSDKILSLTVEEKNNRYNA